MLAALGVPAYRTAFARPKAVVRLQEESVGGARLGVAESEWVDAHWTLAGTAEELRRVCEYIGRA
ncbi:hypothetical protein GCM10010149_80020 [Nonomuraea roseoviolacea subsp. roseoviolacea]